MPWSSGRAEDRPLGGLSSALPPWWLHWRWRAGRVPHRPRRPAPTALAAPCRRSPISSPWSATSGSGTAADGRGALPANLRRQIGRGRTGESGPGQSDRRRHAAAAGRELDQPIRAATRTRQRPGRTPARRALLPERGPAHAHRAHALRQCRRGRDRGLSARGRRAGRDDRARGPGGGHAGHRKRRAVRAGGGDHGPAAGGGARDPACGDGPAGRRDAIRRAAAGGRGSAVLDAVLSGGAGRRGCGHLSTDRRCGAPAVGWPAGPGRGGAGPGAGRGRGGRARLGAAQLDRRGAGRCGRCDEPGGARGRTGPERCRTQAGAILCPAAGARPGWRYGSRRRGCSVGTPGGTAPGAAGRTLPDAGRLAPLAAGGGRGGAPGRNTAHRHCPGFRRSCHLPRVGRRGRVPPRAAAGEPEPDRVARPGPRPDPARRPRRRHGAAAERCRGRSRQLALALLSRQGLLHRARGGCGSKAVCHRQGSRPDRPHTLVLRRDPAAARQPAGGGAALGRPVDRAQRPASALPLAAAARPGPGHAGRQSRPDLPGPGVHPARHQRGAPRADARSGRAAPRTASWPTFIRASLGWRLPGSASCCSRSSCSRSE